MHPLFSCSAQAIGAVESGCGVAFRAVGRGCHWFTRTRPVSYAADTFPIKHVLNYISGFCNTEYNESQSLERLKKHNYQLAKGVKALSDQCSPLWSHTLVTNSLADKDYASRNYANMEGDGTVDAVKNMITRTIDGLFCNPGLDLSYLCVERIIKDNLCLIAANLIDRTFGPKKEYYFSDLKLHPAKIIELISPFLRKYLDKLSQIAQLSDEKKQQAYQSVSAELLDDFLSKCFPNGYSDLQVRYCPKIFPILPSVKYLIWHGVRRKALKIISGHICDIHLLLLEMDKKASSMKMSPDASLVSKDFSSDLVKKTALAMTRYAIDSAIHIQQLNLKDGQFVSEQYKLTKVHLDKIEEKVGDHKAKKLFNRLTSQQNCVFFSLRLIRLFRFTRNDECQRIISQNSEFSGCKQIRRTL